MKRRLMALLLGLGLLVPMAAKAQANDPLVDKLVEKGTLTQEEAAEIRSKGNPLLKGLSIDGLMFFDYSAGTKSHNHTDYNTFSLTRGYLNVKKDVNPWLKMRMTTDLYTPGSTVGSSTDNSMTIRMKYLYADFLAGDIGPATQTTVRAGLEQTPWLDFEESINTYRLQGTMFQERFGQFNAADLGVSVLGNFGGTLGKEELSSIGASSAYAGRYGSYYVGVYNGGGYKQSTDANQNKAVEGRVTVRPLPEILPGLQLSYLGITGKGNKATATVPLTPKWENSTGLVSYQHKYFDVTAEYMRAKGEQAGTDEKNSTGYSFFADAKIPGYEKVSVFGRWDTFDPDISATNDVQVLTIAGVRYKLADNSYLLAAYENTHYQNTGYRNDTKGQAVLQVAF